MIEIPFGFNGFDSRKPVEIYVRNLPHWRQDGATYSVTFRLADALPQHVKEEVKEEMQRFRACKEKGGEASLGSPAWLRHQALVSRRVQAVLDENHGSAVLGDPLIAEKVVEVLHARDGIEYELYTFVVMPNHCHVILKPGGDVCLEKSIQAWKSVSARRINSLLGRKGNLWQLEYYDRIVRDDDEFRRATEYVETNPEKAGLVNRGIPLWRWTDP
jgi:REP element-mobilizing transposase RayT